MRIEPNLYLVGSGSLGFDLTDPLDCNIYLFDAGGSYLLFDIGTGDKKRYLVGADAIFYGGRVIWQNTYDCNVPDTLASIKLLADYSFEALLPGHLNFSLNNGKRHIETACDIIGKLGCPTSIL